MYNVIPMKRMMILGTMLFHASHFIFSSDIKECDTNPCDNVNGGCTELIPGYQCYCNAGYETDPTDAANCISEW